MSLLPRRTLICGLLLIGLAVPALAQSTREEWLALRGRKQARHHRLPSLATQPNAFTITTIRFFSDASGNLVGVGEARNDTPYDLSYSRINFKFLNAAGAEIAREWTYLHGGVNARILGNNANETLLVPGAIGFFKIWTTIPASSMSSYTAVSAAENLAYVPPQAAFVHLPGSLTGRPEEWDPWVFGGVEAPVQQRASGRIFNDNPFDSLGDPRTNLPSYFAHDIQLSVAAYQDGVISDVQTTIVSAPSTADPCRGERVTGMGIENEAWVTLAFAQPANRIGRKSIEWQETVVTPRPIGFPGQGGPVSFIVERECGWTVRSTVPWITVIEGSASDRNAGRFTVYVEPNPTSTIRSASLIVSGESFHVVQGVSCELVFNPTVFLGPGRNVYIPLGAAPGSCLWGTRSDVPWLTLNPITLRLEAEPNFTGATRRAVVTVGPSSFTVHQSPASRQADFNNDGNLDLLWRHRDGRIAVWQMNGLQIKEATLLSPSRWNPAMTPVNAADFGLDGTTDILWQSTVDGSPAAWRMIGTAAVEQPFVLYYEPTDNTRTISAVADISRDGQPDLIWQDQDDGTIYSWLMWGSINGMQRMRTIPVGPGAAVDLDWKIAGSGDFNRDGWPDLVWQHQTDGRIALWKMTGTSFTEAAPLGPGRVTDLEWKIRAVGDMNGDDMPDLIWQHRVDGRVAVWVMSGTTMASAAVIAQLSDTNWEIVGPR